MCVREVKAYLDKGYYPSTLPCRERECSCVHECLPLACKSNYNGYCVSKKMPCQKGYMAIDCGCQNTKTCHCCIPSTLPILPSSHSLTPFCILRHSHYFASVSWHYLWVITLSPYRQFVSHLLHSICSVTFLMLIFVKTLLIFRQHTSFNIEVVSKFEFVKIISEERA